MTPSAIVPNPTKPPKLRWREPSPLTGELALAPSRAGFYLVAMIWNGAFALVGATLSNPKGRNLVPFALVFSLVFVVLFVRALVVRSRLRFDARLFSVRTTLLGGEPLDVPLAELDRFEPRHSDAENRNDVFCVLRGGAERRVPIELEPARIGMRGSKKAFWSSPAEHAAFVAARLNAMLEAARLLGHDTYRT